ncbi:MAG: hypothetical protein JWM54_1680 [Acidobacteriaceae bacterium]|jgi:hypothetical protein|nr:hypothetical protein [Acidobacteriaceae bacterium]
MQVHIFRGKGRIFGFTENAAGENLPSRYGPWAAFKTLKISRGEAQTGVNADECLNDIEEQGFHLTDAHVRITGPFN